MYSHQFSRLFQPEKIRPPRVFQPISISPEQNLYLEIGAGKGKHALAFTAQNRDKYLIAIERTKEKFQAFEKALSQNVRPNLLALHADAIAWSVHALPPKSLAGIYILYPNPESNNANQRWLNMPFFEFLLSRMRSGAEIVLATNIEAYAMQSHKSAAEIWRLSSVLSKIPDHFERTHFEVKYLARGESCWQLNITKPEDYQTRFDDVSFCQAF